MNQSDAICKSLSRSYIKYRYGALLLLIAVALTGGKPAERLIAYNRRPASPGGIHFYGISHFAFTPVSSHSNRRPGTREVYLQRTYAQGAGADIVGNLLPDIFGM